MKKSIEEMLKAIQEGSIEDILDDLDDDELEDLDKAGDDDEEEEAYDDDDYVDLDSFDPNVLAEAAIAIIESEVGGDRLEQFITENVNMLVRDGILTEEVAATAFKSYVVLSPEARRKKAINILKLRMARDAGDTRYKKLVVARQLSKKLLEEIRKDPKYKKAEVIVKKMKFKVVSNPEAKAALTKMKSTQLQ